MLDLTQAIGLAGGYTRIANPARTTLKRTVNGKEEVYNLNAKDMIKRADTHRFRVLPGDTITVAKSLF
jgi:protein involved in polysaccharide export with SLBB domain